MDYLKTTIVISGSAYPSTSTTTIDSSNKGHQLLQKMGWSAGGLGASGQGIAEPISGGIVRDKQDQYKGNNYLQDLLSIFMLAGSVGRS